MRVISVDCRVETVAASSYNLAETLGDMCTKIMEKGPMDNNTLAMIWKICFVTRKNAGEG
jgi:hypothetical protein